MNTDTTLSILQYNVRKSRDMVMATLLRDPAVAKFDVVAVQEPWRNPYMATTHHPAKDVFHLCYPETAGGNPARVCFFVNKRLEHTKWRFEAHSRDAATLTVTMPEQSDAGGRISIHNIYNPPQSSDNRTSMIPTVRRLLEAEVAGDQIVLGDFNLHHTVWGGEGVRDVKQEAEDLVDIMSASNMACTLPVGATTYEEGNARTTIDLCWMTNGLLDRLVATQVDRSLDHDSDHLPISTILDLRVIQHEQKPLKPWRVLDCEKFCKALKTKLPSRQRPRTITALEEYVSNIVDAIGRTADQVLPARHALPKAREGWTAECSRALADCKRLKRLHNQLHTEESWEAYRAARNKKGKTIRRALRQAHRSRVEAAAESPESLWKLSKWVRSREHQAPSITPTIKCPRTEVIIQEVEVKAEVFRETFFPPPVTAVLDDARNVHYTNQVKLPPITEKEVKEAIAAAAPLKAPGPDGIPNKALQAADSLLAGHLTRVFEQSLRMGHCPSHFRTSKTIVLRKPGKSDYTVPKAYRPIALLNTIGKIMDAVLARRLSYLVESQDILPDAHMGGRKRRSTEHAIHAILERIYTAWNTGEGEVASLLLLDVSGAFDNVSHERLLHNLRSRRVDERLVRWIASFLSDRRTSIILDGHQSEEYAVETGIPQGSPLSPILYILYNAGLIEDCATDDRTAVVGYIDDAAILAWGKTTTETCTRLAEALGKAHRDGQQLTLPSSRPTNSS